ncbi:MAG TPA: DUF6522 family protein [Roseiarcus sp.]|nr:DUF6522 family protein [Roseiarcus sp.]
MMTKLAFDAHEPLALFSALVAKTNMPLLEFEQGSIQVDATVVAEGLGIAPAVLLERMRDGRITSLCEKGVDTDSGRFRLTFFFENRRFRLVVDEGGAILKRSAIDFGGKPPASLRRAK